MCARKEIEDKQKELKKQGLSVIADRYARAMIEIAEKQCNLDAVNSDLYLIKEIINTNTELKDFIEHPLVKNEDKKEALTQIFAKEIQESTLNLVKVMADGNRLFILPFIADYYNKLLSEKRNMDTAEVITAISIDEHTLNRVKEKLEKLFSKQINVESTVDKSIIAGMVVKFDGKVIDGSMKTKFENMKKQLC